MFGEKTCSVDGGDIISGAAVLYLPLLIIVHRVFCVKATPGQMLFKRHSKEVRTLCKNLNNKVTSSVPNPSSIVFHTIMCLTKW